MGNSVLNYFLAFLTKNERIEEGMSLRDKIIFTLKLYFYLIFLSYFFTLIITGLANLFNLYEISAKSESTSSFPSKIIYLVVLLIIVPIHEELMFRLFLTRFEKRKFFVSISLIFSSVLYWSIYKILIFPYWIDKQLMHYIYLFFFYALFHLLFYLLSSNLRNIKFFEGIWNKKYLLIFYLVSIIFTLLHFKNTAPGNFAMIIRVLYLIPMFLFSLSLGFIRENFGIIYAILFHMLFNLPSTLIAVIIMYPNPK